MHRQDTIHALLEVDVTDARRSIRECRSLTGEPFSLTAWIAWCFAQALQAHPRMHAYRKGPTNSCSLTGVTRDGANR